MNIVEKEHGAYIEMSKLVAKQHNIIKSKQTLIEKLTNYIEYIKCESSNKKNNK
tara:strand:+ start:607 stop:768 length:162 start_codon:yes stop_codon:yes gene_type:complete